MGPNWERVTKALHSNQPVHGLTHAYYNYPARFDPQFVRTVIEECTENNDIVLDPYMGGGTSIVEAIASGRRAIGFDINPLSRFLTAAKTTPLSQRDVEAIRRWAERLDDELAHLEVDAGQGGNVQLLNVGEPVSQIFAHAAESVRVLEFPRQRRFARCVLLRWGQWAIDGRRHSPELEMMRARIVGLTEIMLAGLAAFTDTAAATGVAKNALTGRRNIYRGSAARLPRRIATGLDDKAQLVLTSPPYPGVHVLYHRWQSGGRRETPAPYYLAGLTDGHYASYYTMGSRTPTGLRLYFAELEAAFASIRQMLDTSSLVVQLVGFSDPQTQLPLYLSVMKSAGYRPVGPSMDDTTAIPVRTVPNRKWYAQTDLSEMPASSEFLMCHSPSG